MHAGYSRALSAGLVAVVAAVGLGAGPSAEAAGGEGSLRQLLANNPGATVAGRDSVALPDGVTLSLPTAKAGADVDDLCTYEHLCLYEKENFGGQKLTLELNCKLHNVEKIKMTNGNNWSSARSYINNQKAGTWASFWFNSGATDAVSASWSLVESSKARGKGLNQGVSAMPVSGSNLVRTCTGQSLAAAATAERPAGGSPQARSASTTPVGAGERRLTVRSVAPGEEEEGDGTIPVATEAEKLKAAPVVGLDLLQSRNPLGFDDRDFAFELWLLAKPGSEVQGTALLAVSDWDAESKTCLACSLFIRRGIHEAAARDARNEVRDRTSAEVAARRRTQAAELVDMPVSPRLVSTGDRDFVIALFKHLKDAKPDFTATVAAAEAAFTATAPGAVESFLAGGLAETHALEQRRLIAVVNENDAAAEKEANRRFNRKRAANAVGVDAKVDDERWMTTTDAIFLRDLARELKDDAFWSLTYAAVVNEVINGTDESAKAMIDAGLFDQVERDRVRRDKEIADGYRAKVTEVRDTAIREGRKNIARAGTAALASDSIGVMWSYLENRKSLAADSSEMTLLHSWQPNTTEIITRSRIGRFYVGDNTVWKSAVGSWDIAKSKPLNGDFDGDGKRDLAVVYGSGASWRLQLVTNLDSPKPAPKLVWDSPANPTTKKGYDLKSATGGDFNGDGRTDVAVYGNNAAAKPIVLVLTPDSKGVWTAKEYAVAAALVAGRLVAGDVNGDKKSDLITVVQDAAKGMQIWVAVSGASGPGAAVAKWADKNFSVATTTEPVAADFDRNGLAELALFRQEKSGTVNNGASLHRFAGLDGTVARSEPWRVEGGLDASKVILNAADVNGDDYVDLIVHYTRKTDLTHTYRFLSGPDGFHLLQNPGLLAIAVPAIRVAR